MLRIAVQSKGRLFDDTMNLLAEADIKVSASKRTLLVQSSNFPLEVLYLRDDDIPQSVASGVADIGIVGENEFVERGENAQIIDRQGCKSVTQIEIMPKPVEGPEDPKNPWPNWPRTLKTTSSHEEGCTRRWNINSLEFLGKNGKLTGVKVQPIDWEPNPEGGRPLMVEAGEPEIIKAEAVFLAMGFLKPQQPEFAENVFVAGDAASGASLVVRAMASGRKIAAQVDKFLNK